MQYLLAVTVTSAASPLPNGFTLRSDARYCFASAFVLGATTSSVSLASLTTGQMELLSSNAATDPAATAATVNAAAAALEARACAGVGGGALVPGCSVRVTNLTSVAVPESALSGRRLSRLGGQGDEHAMLDGVKGGGGDVYDFRGRRLQIDASAATISVFTFEVEHTLPPSEADNDDAARVDAAVNDNAALETAVVDAGGVCPTVALIGLTNYICFAIAQPSDLLCR